MGAVAATLVFLAGCTSEAGSLPNDLTTTPRATASSDPTQSVKPDSSDVTITFAGDIHFEGDLASLLSHADDALSPIADVLGDADVTMVNLETAITERGQPEPKEYQFRTSPRALYVLDAAGVDVVTVANNHGADYGPVGLRDTLAAKRNSPIPVIGVGRNQKEAFKPFRTTINGTPLAFFAADTFELQSHSSVWTAGRNNPGLAAARGPHATALRDAVRRASAAGDTVIVYLHWGEELVTCPTSKQHRLARMLAAAGADVVVGSHSHVLMGSGWLGDTYVDYGLGNFVWYNDASPETGVLRLTLHDGAVVNQELQPARIPSSGVPEPLTGVEAADAQDAWRSLRGCTELSDHPPGQGQAQADLPTFMATIQPIDATMRAGMSSTYQAGCPVPIRQLRILGLSLLGFDGRSHRGQLIVNQSVASDVVSVFETLYKKRWPIQRMQQLQVYRGNNDRSLAANNTAGFNCRVVKGTDRWSDHAFGKAIDINPVQNPYVLPGDTRPPNGGGFALLDRSRGAVAPYGVITEGDVVVRAFARIGWEWGGHFSSPDYQHFYSPA